jgi:hypothetical protein
MLLFSMIDSNEGIQTFAASSEADFFTPPPDPLPDELSPFGVLIIGLSDDSFLFDPEPIFL